MGALGLYLTLGAGCAGESRARSSCAQSSWSGSCKLRDLRKVEDRELPIPYVVYEAIYAPESNAQYPSNTPAEVRMRFGAPARLEFALIDHLKTQATVACQSQVAQGSCISDAVVASVVPFDPDRVAPAPPVRASGCAAIEASSEQDRLSQSRNSAGASIAERFVFGVDSSSLSPDATATASVVAKELTADPTLECIGLVGQIAPGESPSLAEARARAIKALLVSLGVERGRLLTIAATANVFGPVARPLDSDSTNRKVSLTVLLRTAPAAAP